MQSAWNGWKRRVTELEARGVMRAGSGPDVSEEDIFVGSADREIREDILPPCVAAIATLGIIAADEALTNQENHQCTRTHTSRDRLDRHSRRST